MKSIIFSILLIFVVNAVFAQYNGFIYDGFERTYLLHLPGEYSPDVKYPLVIAMHGGFGSADNLQNQSQLSVKADAENFVVVYPEGVKGGVLDIRTWNAGWCCGYASNSYIDDIGFINALLDTLINRYSIDKNRIYATGMSNGGFMAYRLACELSDRIAAIAPVAATMSMAECNPSRPVPVIHFHSFADSSVPYSGGIGDGVSSHYNPPIDSVLNEWAAFNNCQTANDTIVSNDHYTYVSWDQCECQSQVQLYITEDGGHSWPGGQQTVVGDPTSNYIRANDLMWEFFKQHPLTCASELTGNEVTKYQNHKIELFPNPTKGIVNIALPPESKVTGVFIRNLSGRLVKVMPKNERIDISALPKGIYLISVRTEKNPVMHRVIRKE